MGSTPKNVFVVHDGVMEVSWCSDVFNHYAWLPMKEMTIGDFEKV